MNDFHALSDDELNFWVMVVDNGWEEEAHPDRQNLTFLGKRVAHWDIDDELQDIPDYLHDKNYLIPLVEKYKIGGKCVDFKDFTAFTPEGISVTADGPGRAACIAFLMLRGPKYLVS